MRTMERPYIETKERKENLELSQKLRETRLAIAEQRENIVGHNKYHLLNVTSVSILTQNEQCERDLVR